MKHTKRVILLILVLLFSMSVFASVSPEIIGEATIRIQDPMGLRIKATIDCEKAYDEYTYEYGFLVTRKVFLTGNGYTCNDLTFDCDIYFDKGVAKGDE